MRNRSNMLIRQRIFGQNPVSYVSPLRYVFLCRSCIKYLSKFHIRISFVFIRLLLPFFIFEAVSCTKMLNMNDNNGNIRLIIKIWFKLQKDTYFICKIPFLKMIGIQLFDRLKSYMLEICQIVQKVDYQGGEGKSFLVLININVGFQIVP